MVYSLLFFLFLLAFLNKFASEKENKQIAAIMAFVLFALVALRSDRVGPDTWGYVQVFLNPNSNIYGNREFEGFFVGWMEFWRNFNLSGQLYKIVCAIASIGLVLVVMWKSSKQRIWTYTLFLVLFSWSFYLSGIRQALAMGSFTFGTYLLSRNLSDLSVSTMKYLFKRENLIAVLFLVLSPMFHTTAIFADVMLVVALFSPKNKKSFYIAAIILSFFVCVTAVFKNAEQLLQDAFDVVSSEIDAASRYSGYTDQDYTYNTDFYIVLKEALPINFIAIFSLLLCKRDYDIYERLFFWLVIMSDLFFYFPYMFRMKMYFYPMGCIAVTNMIWPALYKKKFDVNHAVMIAFVILLTYVSYVNLSKQDTFKYEFFFFAN